MTDLEIFLSFVIAIIIVIGLLNQVVGRSVVQVIGKDFNLGTPFYARKKRYQKIWEKICPIFFFGIGCVTGYLFSL